MNFHLNRIHRGTTGVRGSDFYDYVIIPYFDIPHNSHLNNIEYRNLRISDFFEP